MASCNTTYLPLITHIVRNSEPLSFYFVVRSEDARAFIIHPLGAMIR